MNGLVCIRIAGENSFYVTVPQYFNCIFEFHLYHVPTFALIVYGGSVFRPWCVIQYLVSFLVRNHANTSEIAAKQTAIHVSEVYVFSI